MGCSKKVSQEVPGIDGWKIKGLLANTMLSILGKAVGPGCFNLGEVSSIDGISCFPEGIVYLHWIRSDVGVALGVLDLGSDDRVGMAGPDRGKKLSTALGCSCTCFMLLLLLLLCLFGGDGAGFGEPVGLSKEGKHILMVSGSGLLLQGRGSKASQVVIVALRDLLEQVV